MNYEDALAIMYPYAGECRHCSEITWVNSSFLCIRCENLLVNYLKQEPEEV